MDPFASDDLFSVFNEADKKPQQKNRKRQFPVDEEDGKDAKIVTAMNYEDVMQDKQKKSRKDKKNANNNDSEAKPAEDGSATAAKPTNSMEQLEQQAQQQNGGSKPEDVAAASVNEGTEDTSAVPLPGLAATRESCSHDVALPPGWTGPNPMSVPPPLRKPAKTYPFTLDPFQRESVNALEKGESVLVSAHTSAGKTAVAEYAIAMSLRDKQRVIYTSPIKALSNQKFRELTEEFKDVGLMTGDVTISPNASCLVMTTEILRSMLYRGSEILREVAWVIFDEIHYMRDKERGVVWEETLILLPDNVRFVFLSATIPNALEFAEWIAKLHNQPVHVVYTDYRPTPLQHYMFPLGGDGIHLVVDEKGRFREQNFQKCLMTIASKGVERENPQGRLGGKKKGKGANSDIFKIVKMIMERRYEPVIVFSFSKRECEANALNMAKLDFNEAEEKQLVEEVYLNAIDSLSDDDKKLPQVEHILPLLKRGIGIHHSGLLPILKEVIEILFQEGLIKCLFSTETFSMGLNMPARTVVFTNCKKFDGRDFRWISAGEYIQMSGRAGRRGLDDRGIVIMMVDDQIEPNVVKNMIGGKADPLNSTFHLSYNMLLNLLRVEEVNPEYMMERSFYNFQHQKQRPQMEEKLAQLEEDIKKIEIREEDQVAEYYDLKQELLVLREEIRKEIIKPIHCLPFIQPGRLIRVQDGEDDWGWGVVVNFQRKSDKNAKSIETNPSQYIIDVLLECRRDSIAAAMKNPNLKPKPVEKGTKGEMVVVPIQMDIIQDISSLRVYIPKDLRTAEHRESVLISVNEVKKRFPQGVPLLDPVEDMDIDNSTFKKTLRKVETLENKLKEHPLRKAKDIEDLYAAYDKKKRIDDEIKQLKKAIRSTGQLILKDQLKAMMRVLRRLGFTNSDNVIQVKGRVAAEINSADELVLTELMFNGVFNDLTPVQIVSLLSCMVYQEKSSSDTPVRLRDELQGPYRQLQEAARRVAKVSKESKIEEMDEDDYVQSFLPDMMEVTYAWAKGSKFAEICKMTDIFEGSIIRAMRRLEELLRQLCVAAKSIGDDSLEKKFLEGISSIKRDIVFAASLYL